MLKKLGAVLLITLYTVTVAGFALNIHYCFNRVASVSFNKPAKNCGLLVKSKMKCCKDAHLDVKVKDAHQGQPAAFIAKIFAVESPLLAFRGCLFAFQEQVLVNDNYRGPPDGIFNNKATFIKNRIFRI